MAKRSLSSDKTKRLLLAGLGILLLAVFVYQFFLKDSNSSRPRRNLQAGANPQGIPPPGAGTTPAVPQIRKLGTAAQQEAALQLLLSDMTPLNLRMISSGGGGSEKPGTRGNIFAYYVEPPKPPDPPPPPPPIQLIGIQPQSAVAGVPRSFTLVISGNKIPADGEILFDGTARVTKRVSDSQLSTEMAPGDYVFARNINVQVKSKSDPKENSNSIPFVVQAAPEPSFVYKGRLGTLNQPQYNYGLFENVGTKQIIRAKVGETITNVWRVDAISADSVELTHTQYEIKRRLPLQEKVR